MAWFGSVRSFHASCLNHLATSLAKCHDVPWEKVQKLLDYCPAVSSPSSGEEDLPGPSCVLHDRALSAVVALGRLAVETRLKVHGERLVRYLLQLWGALPSAQWLQNTQAMAKREGLIVEQFCYKLGLILLNVAAITDEHRMPILSAVVEVMETFVQQFLNTLNTESDELCLVTIPAILGVAKALQGSVGSRLKAFRSLYASESEGVEGQEEVEGEELILTPKNISLLLKLLLEVLNPLNLKTANSKLDQLDSQAVLYPYHSLGVVLRCHLVTLLRDTVISAQHTLPTPVRVQVLKLSSSQINTGIRELSSGGTSSGATERAVNIIGCITSAVELLVWAVEEDSEIDSAFQRLSSLLTVHTAKFSVLVTPLRASILEGIAVLAEKSGTVVSPALTRFKEFLSSTLLYGMYSDALAGGNVDFATSEPPKSFLQLWSFSSEPVHISRIDAFTTVQLALGRAVCKTLLAGTKENTDCVEAFLASLGNKLYTTDAENERALRTAECIVMLLGQVAVVMHESHTPGVVEQVVAIFQQRLFHPACTLDGNIVIELGKMAARTEDRGTIEALGRLMTLSLGERGAAYTDKDTASFSHIFQPMVDALLHVARHLSDTDLRMELTTRSLQLFVQLGIDARRASEREALLSSHKATSSSFSLGLLLPVIAKLVQRMEPIAQPSLKTVKLFRDFWLYCVIMGFSETNTGVFPQHWYKNVGEVASRSPLLLSMGAEQYLDKELELNHPLKAENIAPGELQEAKQSLLDQLGRSTELDKLVYRLSFVQCMYLHSIYRLESLRLQTDTELFPLIFKYLEDKGLQGELWVAIEAIANKLFQQYLSQMEEKPADEARKSEVESHAQLMAFMFCHLRGRIKHTADKFLTKMIDKFSHILWSKRVLHTMLDLLHAISLTLCNMDPGSRRAVQVSLPHLPHSIMMPENSQKREKTVHYFATRCEQILDLSMKWAPSETRAILEEYICQLGAASAGLVHHSGVAMATAQLSKPSQLNPLSNHLPSTVTTSRHSSLTLSLSLSSSSLHLRSLHMGEVQGLRRLTTSSGRGTGSISPSMGDLSAMMITELQEALTAGSREQVTATMYRSTALLIATEGTDRSLLFHVCQAPVRTFTEVAIATAIECWHWLLTARADLEYPFMREFAAVWKWTIEERKGMFAQSADELGVKVQIHPPPLPTKPHLLLIKFLSDRFDVVNTRDSAQLNLIAEILHQSLTLGVGPACHQPQFLSHAPEATGPRFKLLTLGVSLLRGKLVVSPLERTVLREKIYNAALDHFCYNPSWPVQDNFSVRETVAILVKFWKSVKELRNVSILTNLTSSTLEATQINRRSNSFWQLAESSPTPGNWMNTLSSSHRRSASASHVPFPSFPSPGLQGTSQSRKSSQAVKSKVLLKRKNVILALVRHEIERLSVWQNPSGLPEMNVPGEDEVSSWVNPTQTERHWRSTIVMLFHASPHLAFQLLNRFRGLDVIPKEVSRLIRSDPVSFVNIPDAAQYLAKRESVQQDAPELYHLLYWRNVSPAAALIFFSRPFSFHPITAQFANKAMHSFQPDDILLYIPQLVQALRYDKLGFAKAYILKAAKHSQLLAHQFLWNMEANKYADEEGKQKDAEIGDLLESLEQEIQDGLSGAALKFYEREFAFFTKVTNISAVIRPFPKPQRKAECLRALREIQLEPGVYLPSNPDCVVMEIDYKSGTPMQSAAKAPFMARFKVVKCGTSEVESMNTREGRELVRRVSQSSGIGEGDFWQASIFKVGDDVRQDMLALQIIQLCKDVFQEVGLELYLVPYRVVATASGCGVIECVPDSKSRDQLGKQTQVSLKDYFHTVYGDEDSVAYQNARANFIKSMAAYSLVSYLLQIKDRHNGNIMINKQGHIIHIDFGFLFESSPGGNIGFEPDLKLTEEMLELMGGKRSAPYRWFLDLCVQGYLSIRPYQEQIVSLVCLMLHTGFPCFRGNTIEELRARFRPQLGEREAAKAIIEVVEASCLNFRTKSYDVIQEVQQQIYYHKKST